MESMNVIPLTSTPSLCSPGQNQITHSQQTRLPRSRKSNTITIRPSWRPGQDAVVSAIAGEATANQTKIIDAVIEAVRSNRVWN